MSDGPDDGPDDAADASGPGRPTATRYEAFLRGERTDDVLVYLHESVVGSVDALEAVGHRVADGVVLVLPGPEGRSAFQQATGLDAMAFAGRARDTEGRVDRDCTGGDCPVAAADDADPRDHRVGFVFAFAEAQNDAVGGLYAEGDVVHAYAACDCGTAFSDRWVAEP